MPYTGQEDHSISLDDAIELTKRFRDSVTSPPYYWGGYFGKTAIQSILSQQGCVGIRIYNAAAANGTLNYVVVGVDSSGEDMENDQLAEHVRGCPPYCPTNSKLAGTA
jgi:hypothetical protein